MRGSGIGGRGSESESADCARVVVIMPRIPVPRPPIPDLRSPIPDSRPPSAVGRQARLDLAFERRGDRTVLVRSYVEPPFRVGRTFVVGDAAYVIVVCSGPGVFGGDELVQSVSVGSGARVVLTSQAALQVHPGAGASATIVHDSRVEDGGELHCHWDPVIPFADASLSQRFTIDLVGRARLYWSDALMSGRTAHGERWRFRALAHELRVRVNDRTAYLERYRLAPAERAVSRPWLAGDADYIGTTLVRAPGLTHDVSERLHQGVDRIEGVHAAVDLVAPSLLVARLLGACGVAFAAARAELRRSAAGSIFQATELAARK